MSEGYLVRPDAFPSPSTRGIRVPINLGFWGHAAIGQAPFIALAAASAAWNTPMYVPHRQMLPSSPRLTSSRVGFGFWSSNDLQAVTKPGVQYPHIRASFWWKAW